MPKNNELPTSITYTSKSNENSFQYTSSPPINDSIEEVNITLLFEEITNNTSSVLPNSAFNGLYNELLGNAEETNIPVIQNEEQQIEFNSTQRYTISNQFPIEHTSYSTVHQLSTVSNYFSSPSDIQNTIQTNTEQFFPIFSNPDSPEVFSSTQDTRELEQEFPKTTIVVPSPKKKHLFSKKIIENLPDFIQPLFQGILNSDPLTTIHRNLLQGEKIYENPEGTGNIFELTFDQAKDWLLVLLKRKHNISEETIQLLIKFLDKQLSKDTNIEWLKQFIILTLEICNKETRIFFWETYKQTLFSSTASNKKQILLEIIEKASTYIYSNGDIIIESIITNNPGLFSIQDGIRYFESLYRAVTNKTPETIGFLKKIILSTEFKALDHNINDHIIKFVINSNQFIICELLPLMIECSKNLDALIKTIEGFLSNKKNFSKNPTKNATITQKYIKAIEILKDHNQPYPCKNDMEQNVINSKIILSHKKIIMTENDIKRRHVEFVQVLLQDIVNAKPLTSRHIDLLQGKQIYENPEDTGNMFTLTLDEAKDLLSLLLKTESNVSKQIIELLINFPGMEDSLRDDVLEIERLIIKGIRVRNNGILKLIWDKFGKLIFSSTIPQKKQILLDILRALSQYFIEGRPIIVESILENSDNLISIQDGIDCFHFLYPIATRKTPKLIRFLQDILASPEFKNLAPEKKNSLIISLIDNSTQFLFSKLLTFIQEAMSSEEMNNLISDLSKIFQTLEQNTKNERIKYNRYNVVIEKIKKLNTMTSNQDNQSLPETGEPLFFPFTEISSQSSTMSPLFNNFSADNFFTIVDATYQIPVNQTIIPTPILYPPPISSYFFTNQNNMISTQQYPVENIFQTPSVPTNEDIETENNSNASASNKRGKKRKSSHEKNSVAKKSRTPLNDKQPKYISTIFSEICKLEYETPTTRQRSLLEGEKIYNTEQEEAFTLNPDQAKEWLITFINCKGKCPIQAIQILIDRLIEKININEFKKFIVQTLVSKKTIASALLWTKFEKRLYSSNHPDKKQILLSIIENASNCKYYYGYNIIEAIICNKLLTLNDGIEHFLILAKGASINCMQTIAFLKEVVNSAQFQKLTLEEMNNIIHELVNGADKIITSELLPDIIRTISLGKFASTHSDKQENQILNHIQPSLAQTMFFTSTTTSNTSSNKNSSATKIQSSVPESLSIQSPSTNSSIWLTPDLP